MFEAVNGVYKVSIPIAENARNFQKLTDIHTDLRDAFTNMVRLKGKRIFGTYFRVGFYGSRFGDMDGEEYIYKEKVLAKLPEISHRFEAFYCDKYGKENVVIIKDSKNVEQSKLEPNKAYIQITYVEPYFDDFEMRDRVTAFEKNYNISKYLMKEILEKSNSSQKLGNYKSAYSVDFLAIRDSSKSFEYYFPLSLQILTLLG